MLLRVPYNVVETDDPKDRLRALRVALGLTQQQVAERSGGRLDRVEVNKIENGKVGLATYETRKGFADALGLLFVDDLSDYLDGGVSLAETLRLIDDDKSSGGLRKRNASRRVRERAEWGSALAAARRTFLSVPDEAYDVLGGLVDTIPVKLDAQVVGEMARSLWEASLREKEEVAPSVPTHTTTEELRKRRTNKP